MVDFRDKSLHHDRPTEAERVWLPMLRPATRTFPAFVERGIRNSSGRVRRRSKEMRGDYLAIAILVGLVLGLAGACIYGIYYTPADPWAFDRPEAQLPSPQPHSSYLH
ncbi:MAG TPA: hypothetical protein VMC10_12020 [Stellaceae bacterium]|nr:hypothetical protein [Stellaceae bacterium]